MKSNTDNINAGRATIKTVQGLKVTMAEISPISPNLTRTTITRSAEKVGMSCSKYNVFQMNLKPQLGKQNNGPRR